MKRISLIALTAALATAVLGPAQAQYVSGGYVTLYDQHGNEYYGDPHSTDWYGGYDGSVYNDWYGTGAPTDGYGYAPLTTDDPWSADTSGGYSRAPGEVWSPGRSYE